MNDSVDCRYWCYECHQVVNVVMEPEPKCPSCDSSFVEEMESRGDSTSASASSDGSRRSVSFWAPILFGMLADSSRQSRVQREEEEEDEDDTDLDLEFEELLRRRRRSSAILRVLHSLYDRLGFELDDYVIRRDRERERDNDDGESLVLIDSSNQARIVSDDDLNGSNSDISFGDYFLAPSLDLLLQHLAENDPSRYGTPPAKQEAVDALPTVNITESFSCSVCLEDIDIGAEAKEMPCKHKFHSQCILPWLELHCSCPLCRFQLPADESKISSGSSNRNIVDDANRFNSRNMTADGASSVDEDELLNLLIVD